MLEYSKRSRKLAMELLDGISMSLGLENSENTHIQNALNLELGLQLLAANLYPPCPEPELAMGMPPHSDHGLLTLLTQNGISGLQVQHQGKWVNVNSIPNAFVVNVGDHMEVHTKSCIMRIYYHFFYSISFTFVAIVFNPAPAHLFLF
jgi:isopenicillin N synthase-like dioxygenase